MNIKDEYGRQLLSGMGRIAEGFERAIFEGRIRNRSGEFCVCHDLPITSNGFGMGVTPACSVTRQDLGPNDFVTRPLPDLIWSEAEKKMVEERQP